MIRLSCVEYVGIVCTHRQETTHFRTISCNSTNTNKHTHTPPPFPYLMFIVLSQVAGKVFTVSDHSVNVWYLDNDCAQFADSHSCCFLMALFPLSHLNLLLLLLLLKLAVKFCIFVFGSFEAVYFGVIVQFGKLVEVYL